jgi:aerobic carbon-monoxide dehydrogenase medium subunit
VLACESDGLCRECRVAVTGAGQCAVRAKAVEAVLQGQRLAPGVITQASERAAEGIELLSDLHAGPEYRALLVRTYAKRALLDAVRSIHQPNSSQVACVER